MGFDCMRRGKRGKLGGTSNGELKVTFK